MSPCDGRGASATRRDLLAGPSIEICSEPVELHPGSAPERGDGRLGAYESMPAQRGKLADGDSVPGHDKRLALIKLAHDVTAVIAQLPLSDLFGHTKSVARVLHCRSRCQPPHWAWHGQQRFGVGRRPRPRRTPRSWGLDTQIPPDSLAAQRLSSRTTKSIIGTLTMHTIAEGQSSSSQTSMTKHAALAVIHSDVQQQVRSQPPTS